MAEDWFDIKKIKGAMKKAGSSPVPVAFGVGVKPEDGKLAMHLKRSPEFLVKALKKEGFKPARILVGTASTEGPVLVVTCEAEVPKSIKSVRYFLKENQLVQKKVRLIGPNGEFGDDDAGDEQDTDVVASAEPGASSEEQSEVITRFKAALPLIAAAPHPIAGKLTGAMKQVASHIKSQNFAAAAKLMEKIDQALSNVTISSNLSNKEQQSNNAEDKNNLSERIEIAIKSTLPQIQSVLKRFPSLKGDIATEIAEARKAAKAGKPDDARVALKNLASILKKAVSQKEEASDSVMKLGKARLEWVDIRKGALGSIHKLRDNIRKAYATSPDLLKQVDDRLTRLDAAIGQLNDDLHEALDTVLNESDPGKRGVNADKAADIAKKFLKLARTNPVLSAIDGTVFMPGISVIEQMTNKLNDIISALGRTTADVTS